MYRSRSVLLLLSVCIFGGRVLADDSLQFRGTNSDGFVLEKNVPEVWDLNSQIKWQVAVPGEGWSAPIVVGERLFLTTSVSAGRKDMNSEHDWQVLCFDKTTGKSLWSKSVLKGKPRLGTHRDNTYASETPVCDGKHLVVYFGMMGLVCFDLDGNELWKKDLGNYPMQLNWGTSSSPVMHGNLVYLQVDNDQKSFLVALDIATGVEKWRKDRDESSNWGSPIIWQNAKRTELITAGRTIRSYKPDDGSLLWQLTLNAGGVCSTPTGDSDVLIVGNQGRQGAGMMAVRAGATGDVSLKENEASNSSVLWSTKKFGPQRSSPMMVGGQVYLFGQRDGQLTCVDAKSGEVLYQERIPNAGAFWASPWVNNGLIYCTDENGNTYVLKPGPKLEVVRVNKLPPKEESRFWATSAASDGFLFIRSSNTLFALSAK